jgi:hypothetical protein
MHSRKHFYSGKSISIAWSKFLSATLVIQHVMRMRRFILSSLAWMTLPYFSALSHKWHDCSKTLLNIKCVFWFSLQRLSETFLILRRTERDVIINVHRSSCKVSVILVRLFLKKLNSRDGLSKNTQISSGSGVVPWGRTDKQTDRHTWWS